MRLTIVGCSGSVPSPDSAGSCYLVEHDGFVALLDLGHGAFGPLQRYVDPGLVDAVLLSHLHADHWTDFHAMEVWRHHGPGDATRALTVLAPASGDVADATAWAPSQRVGPFVVTSARVAHPVEAYAIRLEAGGHALTYTGDTGPCDSLVELARGSDVLLSEASFVDGRDNPPDLHLTGREAGEAATAAGVGRLVLTHVPPWESWELAAKQAEQTYSGPIEIARPGLVIEV
ncbi:MAG TPA: MBL fold metallo-hydrolase [Actinomycetes bacterium]|nr:MBL fold metallo-hydrolase [Actinomycetes bacterium]